MEEQWKPVEGYEGLYEVSNFGEVKSLGNNKSRKEKVLKPYYHKGYLLTYLCKDGVAEKYSVYRLVAMAFIPIPERLKDYSLEELDVHHIDGDKTNNHVDNLIWLTKDEHSDLHAKSEETRKRKSAALKGIKRSEATRAKMSAAKKGVYNTALSKAVEAIDEVTGRVVYTFPSTQEAEKTGL